MSLFGKGRGYIGKQWSVNAQDAYDNGEMPKSKWRKSIILDRIEEILEDNNLENTIEDFSKLTLEELRLYLTPTTYHHTGKFYNSTLFYKIDEDAVIIEAKTLEKNNYQDNLIDDEYEI